MNSIHFLGTLAAVVILAAPAQAQQPSGKKVQLSPYAGYMSFGNLVSGPLGSGVSNGSGPAYGAQVTVPLSPSVGVYGNVAYTRAGLEVGVPVIGGVSLGAGSVLLYDGGVQLTLPGRTAQQISPFIQAGIGGMRYSFDLAPIQLNATNLAYNIGVGADLPLGRNFGVRVMAKDYIGKFDASDVAGIDLDTRTTHNWAVSLGITLGF
jgi:hypothetical protein